MAETSDTENEIWMLSEDGLRNPYGAGSEVDWTQYEKLRPTYPSRLFDILTEYMEQHNYGDRQLYIDYGSGNGIIAPELLERCKMERVLATDISSRQLEEGKAKLQSRYGSERFGVMVGSAGNLNLIPDSSVDLVTAAEAVHWFDRQKWLKEVARILKPSGTLAFWHYWAEPFITTHTEATPAVAQLFKRFYQLTVPEGTVTQDQLVYSLSMLDSAHISATDFTHQIRRKWMLPQIIQTQLKDGKHPLYWMLEDPGAVAEAEVVLAAQNVTVETSTPATADEIFMKDTNWTTNTLVGYLRIAIGGPIDHVLLDESFKVHLDRIERIVGGPQGTFDVTWPITLVMGTRA